MDSLVYKYADVVRACPLVVSDALMSYMVQQVLLHVETLNQ